MRLDKILRQHILFLKRPKSKYAEYANLQGADLQNANLRDADLQGANLQNANLRDANCISL